MQTPLCILLWRHQDVPHRNSTTQVFEFRSGPRTWPRGEILCKSPGMDYCINLLEYCCTSWVFLATTSFGEASDKKYSAAQREGNFTCQAPGEWSGFHLNLACHDGLAFRDGKLQHAILAVGFNPLRIGRVRQAETAVERAA
jgi:hypothetical protein